MDTNNGESLTQRLQAALEYAPSGLLMTDATGRIVLLNREIERLFGYSRAELLGQSVEILVPERFQHHAAERVEFMADWSHRALGHGRELCGRHKDGSEIPVEIGLNRLDTSRGTYVLSAVVDISARKLAEAEHRRLEEQLRQAQKFEALGALAGGIAHDFNNILAGISGLAEILSAEITDPQYREDLATILQAAERGKELIRTILVFSREQQLSRRPMALGVAAVEALRLLRAALPATVTVETRMDPATPKVAADPTAVQQILMNLATNAAHAMPEGGVLEIGVEPFYVTDSAARARPHLREGRYAMLTVRDTGQGMEPAVLARALDPFFTTKQAGIGTGLGLALVDGIMRQHEGAVELRSVPGEGTSVRCLFPELIIPEEVAAEARAQPARGQGERVLVIEDEPTLADIAGRHLRELGYRASVFTDPRTALIKFRADPKAFDLVMTDYSMPGIMGRDVALEILALRPDLPVLMTTGFVHAEPAAEATALGIRRVLHKPVSLAELSVALREALDG